MRLRVWTLVLIAILGLLSCDKKKSNHSQVAEVVSNYSAGRDSLYIKGSCFDKVISPYVYQIAQVEGPKVFYFAMGKASKEVMTSTIEELFKGEDPFHIVDCP